MQKEEACEVPGMDAPFSVLLTQGFSALATNEIPREAFKNYKGMSPPPQTN